MPKKFYVVWVGRETGVFTSWAKTKSQVDQYPKCKFKSFKTRQEAESAYLAGWSRGRQAKPKKSRTASANKPASTRRTSTPTTPSMSEEPAKRCDIEIYCDGACEPNPGESASGLAVYSEGELRELWYGLYVANGTNNTAELNALFQALLIAKEEAGSGKVVAVLSDSKYGISCVTDWAFGWKKKGWKRKKAGDIKNLEIIQSAHEVYLGIKNEVVVSHVSAHVGIEGNELADRMAGFGIDQRAPELCRYSESLDIKEILAFRTG